MTASTSHGTPAAFRMVVLAELKAKLAESIFDHGRPS